MIERVASSDELRAVMRHVPAPVAVVTVTVEGRHTGLTVASLVSLSLEPPLVGFAIRRDAALHELLRESPEHAISVLAAGQEHLAQHFARGVPPIALWDNVPLRLRVPAAPALVREPLARFVPDLLGIEQHAVEVEDERFDHSDAYAWPW